MSSTFPEIFSLIGAKLPFLRAFEVLIAGTSKLSSFFLHNPPIRWPHTPAVSNSLSDHLYAECIYWQWANMYRISLYTVCRHLCVLLYTNMCKSLWDTPIIHLWWANACTHKPTQATRGPHLSFEASCSLLEPLVASNFLVNG